MSDVKPRIKLDKKQAKKGELVEVKGLETGMQIVSAPLPGLRAGQRVKVVETK